MQGIGLVFLILGATILGIMFPFLWAVYLIFIGLMFFSD